MASLRPCRGRRSFRQAVRSRGLCWSLPVGTLLYNVGSLFANELLRAARYERGFGTLVMVALGVPLALWVLWRAWTIIS